MKKGMSAFTIVELLIVIVIIAILAAISIVAYNGIQNRARASEATSALAQAKKQLELYKIDNILYPTTGNLASAGITDGNVTYQYTSDGQTYCITATSGSVSYKTTNTEASSQGGCAGHGQGGVAAVTNVIYNPNIEAGVISPNASYFNAPITVDSVEYAYGIRSAKVTTNSSVNPQGLMWAAPNAQSNTTYTCSISLKGTSGKNVLLSGRAHSPSNAYIGEGYGSRTVSLTPSWQRVNVTFSTPANTGTMYLQYRLATAEAAVEIWGDGAICTQGSSVHEFADGNSPNWVWNGAANNSTSTGPPQ